MAPSSPAAMEVAAPGIGTKITLYLGIPIVAATGCLALVKPVVRPHLPASGAIRYIKGIAAPTGLAIIAGEIMFIELIVAADQCMSMGRTVHIVAALAFTAIIFAARAAIGMAAIMVVDVAADSAKKVAVVCLTDMDVGQVAAKLMVCARTECACQSWSRDSRCRMWSRQSLKCWEVFPWKETGCWQMQTWCQ